MKRIRRITSDSEVADLRKRPSEPVRNDDGRVDIEKAKCIWEEYQKSHDVTERKGQAAGIDSETGDVWFGKDIIDIAKQREAQGLNSPLFFVRVGYPTYYRKKRLCRESSLKS